MNRAQRRAVKYKRKGIVKMEETKQRTMDEVKQEYTNYLASLGDKLVAIDNLNEVVQQIKAKLQELNKEAQAIKETTPEVANEQPQA